MTRLPLAASVAAALMLATTGAAIAGPGVKAGILSCTLQDADTIVIYTNETFTCTYNPADGPNERYSGVIQRIGIDLTLKRDQELIWTVIAPTADVAAGALAGDYSGPSVEAAVGAGVGGKVLIGGSEDTITLQPIAVAGYTGAGASAGIEVFELTYQ